ncbi:hypothetical protein [Saliphagus sp. LR7]|uniref:hypothetical protein n=1 Tax=Saliphagus sp. LR7 TaxID=2282654 RepID=UPI000DF8610E|nr:hypothetical protein [Saliphagus sp. LR7]
MQFRAGILYAVLFVVVAAGAYGVIATASSPSVTADDVEADYTLEEEGQDLEVDGQTFNVSTLSEGSGTVEYVNESAILEVEWSNGDTVLTEEGGQEYEVMISPSGGDGAGNASAGNESGGNASAGNETAGGAGNESAGGNESGGNESAGNESGGNASAGGESGPQAFSLIGEYDEDEYQIEEFSEEDDRPYVITGEGGERTAVPLEEFEEIDSERYEVNDSISFYEEESGQVVEGQVTSVSEEGVTVEYEGEEVTENELAHADTVSLNGQEFAVYFDGETAILSSNVEGLESQQTAVDEFNQRISGLWWVVILSILAMIVTAGLAFMPVRG